MYNHCSGQLDNHYKIILLIALIKDVASGKQQPTFLIGHNPCISKTDELSTGPSTSTCNEQIGWVLDDQNPNIESCTYTGTTLEDLPFDKVLVKNLNA